MKMKNTLGKARNYLRGEKSPARFASQELLEGPKKSLVEKMKAMPMKPKMKAMKPKMRMKQYGDKGYTPSNGKGVGY